MEGKIVGVFKCDVVPLLASMSQVARTTLSPQPFPPIRSDPSPIITNEIHRAERVPAVGVSFALERRRVWSKL
jgi:hypothetical protein